MTATPEDLTLKESLTQTLESNSRTIEHLHKANREIELRLQSIPSNNNPKDLWEDWFQQIRKILELNFPQRDLSKDNGVEICARIDKNGHIQWEMLVSSTFPVATKRISLSKVNLPTLRTPVWEESLHYGIQKSLYTPIEL